MIIRPGGSLASRPLHFFFIADCSGSMALDGKIEALNHAIREVLPHMKTVAKENPVAQIYLRTMRFAAEAQWCEVDAVRLEEYRWHDLQADELPLSPQFSGEFRRRLDREGANSGDVQVSLMWNNYNDLDLHVFTPSGEEICFTNKKSRCSGELDVDMNVSPTSTEPVENVFWPAGCAPRGNYRVVVHHYKNHHRPSCGDPTSFRVAVSIGGNVQEFQGHVSERESVEVTHFYVGQPGTETSPNLTGSSNSMSGNTSMGAALRLLTEQLGFGVMPQRGLPPVAVLISDGQPTDDFEAGLAALMSQKWAQKMVRLAIAIGSDADDDALRRFVGNDEIPVLRANSPEQLINFIRWWSTEPLSNVSQPSLPAGNTSNSGNRIVIAPPPMSVDLSDNDAVW